MSVFDDYQKEKEKSLATPVKKKEGFFKRAAKTAARILLPKEAEYRLGLTKRPGEEVKPTPQPKSIYEQYQQEKGIEPTLLGKVSEVSTEVPKPEVKYENLKSVAKKQLAEIESYLPELKAQYEKMPKGGVVFPEYGLGAVLKTALPPSATQKKMDVGKEIENLTKAADAYREFLSHKETEPGFLNFLADVQKGIQDQEGSKLIPFLGSVESFKEYMDVISATKKKKMGQKITPLESSLIKKYQAKNIPIDRGTGYAVGSTIAQLPTYAAEFAALGPVYSKTKAAVSTGLMKVGVPKLAANATGFVIGGAIQGWANVPEVSERTAQYMLPEADIVMGEDGDFLIAEIDKNGDNFKKALIKAFGTVAVDYITERTGVVVEKPLGFLRRAVLGKWLAKRGLTKLGSSQIGKVVKGAIAWDGIIGEVFEEELAEFFQAPIEERKYKNPFTTPEGVERLLVETLSIGAFGGLGKVSDATLRQIEKFRGEKKPEPIDVTPTPPPPPVKVTKAEIAARLFERKLTGEEQFRKTPQEAELLRKQLAKEEEKGKKERLNKQIDLLLKTIREKPKEKRTVEETRLAEMGEEIKKGAAEGLIKSKLGEWVETLTKGDIPSERAMYKLISKENKVIAELFDKQSDTGATEYYIQRPDGTYLYNPETESAVFNTIPDAMKEFEKTGKIETKKEIITPRDAAIDLIKPYVLRGDDIKEIGQMGSLNEKYNAQVGGYVAGKRIGTDKIAVTEFNGEKVEKIFSLKKLFNEIKSQGIKEIISKAKAKETEGEVRIIENTSEISETPITKELIDKLNVLKAREDNADNLIEVGDYKAYVEGWCEECFPKDLDITEYSTFAERETQKMIEEKTPEGFEVIEAGYIENEIGDNPWGASYIIYKRVTAETTEEKELIEIPEPKEGFDFELGEKNGRGETIKARYNVEIGQKSNWFETLDEAKEFIRTSTKEITDFTDEFMGESLYDYIDDIQGLEEKPEERPIEVEPNEIFEPETDEDYEMGLEAEGDGKVKFDDESQVFHSTETKKETPDPETKSRVSAIKQPLSQLGYALNLIRTGKVVPEELRWMVDDYNQEALHQIGEEVVKDFGNGKYKLIFSDEAQTKEGLDELYPPELYKDIKDYTKLQVNYGIDTGDFIENDVVNFTTENGQRWGRLIDIYDNGRAIVETSTGEVEVDFWSLKKPSKLTKAQRKIAEGIFPEETIKQTFELTPDFMQKKNIELPPKKIKKVVKAKRKAPKRNISSKIFDIIKIATGKRNTLPILQHIAIKGNKIMSTDLDVELIYEAEKDLGNIVLSPASLKGVSIDEIQVNTKAHTAQIGAVNVKATIPISDFPILPEVKIAPQLKVDYDVITTEFSKAAAIINKDYSRPELTALFIKSNKNNLKIVSSDSFRLYQITIPAKIIQDFEALIPKTAVDKLVKILKQVKPDGVIEVSIDKKTKYIKFKFGKFSFFSRLVDAQFPKYQDIIPKKIKNQLVVDREGLLDALNEVPKTKLNNIEIKIDDQKKRLILSIKENEISFKKDLPIQFISNPKDIDIESDLYAVMPIKLDEEGVYSYNVKFLNDFLKKAKSNEIVFSNLSEDAASLLQEKELTTADFVREVPAKYKAIVKKVKPGRIPADRKQYYKRLGEEFKKAEAKLSEREKDELFNLLTFREGIKDYDANTLKQLKKKPVLRKSNLRLQLKKIGFVPTKKLTIESANDVADIFSELKRESKEKGFILNLTKDNEIINIGLDSIGTLTTSLVSPRQVLAQSLASKAKKFYFIHNHPSGDPTPSEADIMITKKLNEAAKNIGIEMVGSIIINHTKYGIIDKDKVEVIKYTPQVHTGKQIAVTEMEQIVETNDTFIKEGNVIADDKSVAQFFARITNPDVPVITLISLNARGKVNGYDVIGSSLGQEKSLIKNLTKSAIRHNAAGMILATNIAIDNPISHSLFSRLKGKIDVLGIDLMDVVYVKENGTHISYKSRGLLNDYNTRVCENISNYGEFSEEEQAVIKAITDGLPVPVELSEAVKSLENKGVIRTSKPEKVKIEKPKKVTRKKPPIKDMNPGERISMRGITLSRSTLSGLTHPYRVSYKSGVKSVIKTFKTIEEARERFNIMVEIRAKGFFKRGELPKELQSTQAQKTEAHQVAQKNKISPSQYKRMALIYTGVDSMTKMTPEQAEKFIEMLKALTPKFGGKITIPRSQKVVTAEEAERKFTNIRVGWLLDIFRSPVNVFRRIGLGKEGKAVFEAFRLKRDFTAKWFEQFNNWQKELGIKGIFYNKKKVKEQSRRLFRAINNPAAEVKLTEQESLIVSRARIVANEIADLVDDARAEVGLDPMHRRENYITNLLTEESHFLIQTTKQAPNELYALLDIKMPSSVFNRLLLERKGGLPIKEDFWQALKAMVQIHGKYIYLHPPVHRLEQFMKFYGDKVPYLSRVYVRSRINRFLGRPNVADRWMRSFDEAVTELIAKIPGLSKKAEIEFQDGVTEIIETPRLLLKPSKVFKLLKAVRYTYDLAFSISFYTINLTQFWLNTVPKLRGNMAEVYQSAFTGYAQMLMDFFRPSKWEYWKKRGVLTEIDNVVDQEFNAHAMAGGEILNLFAKLSEFNNRVGSALATEKNLQLLAKHGKFELLYKELNSMFGEEAENYARNISDITQFRYGMEEKPIFFDSPITDLYYQYNTFALKQIEFTEEMAQHLETTGILKDYRQAVKQGKTKEFFVTLTQGQRGELIRFILNAFILSFFLGWSYIWEAIFKGVIPNQAEGAWKVLKGYWTGDRKLREQGYRQILLPPSWDLIEKVADYGIVATVKNAKAVKQLDLLRATITGEDVELRTMEGKVKEKITPKVATGRLFKSYREETGLINREGWDLYIGISRRYDNVRDEAIKLIIRDQVEEAKTLTRKYNEQAKKDIEKLKELEITDIRLQDRIKPISKSKIVDKADFVRWIKSAKEEY